MPITGIVLASGQRNEPQLTTENVLTITAGFSRLFGPTTLRQTRALTEALTTTWQQSGKKNRQREQQQVTDWIAASQRLLAGYVDDAAVVRDHATSWHCGRASSRTAIRRR